MTPVQRIATAAVLSAFGAQQLTVYADEDYVVIKRLEGTVTSFTYCRIIERRG